jgi:hypothetical protein
VKATFDALLRLRNANTRIWRTWNRNKTN